MDHIDTVCLYACCLYRFCTSIHLFLYSGSFNIFFEAPSALDAFLAPGERPSTLRAKPPEVWHAALSEFQDMDGSEAVLKVTVQRPVAPEAPLLCLRAKSIAGDAEAGGAGRARNSGRWSSWAAASKMSRSWVRAEPPTGRRSCGNSCLMAQLILSFEYRETWRDAIGSEPG